jgi:hypothetical protein
MKNSPTALEGDKPTQTVTAKAPIEGVLPGTKRKYSQREFIGRDIREAQKIADGDSSKLVFAIIAVTTEIEGGPITAEELDEMNGLDVMELMKGFGTAFTSAPNS